MRIDVFSAEAPRVIADLHDRVVLVDRRAAGVDDHRRCAGQRRRAVIPFESVDEAITRAKSLERSEVLLAGERKMAPIRASILATRRASSRRDVVNGKTIVMTTTNGTAALSGTAGRSRGARRRRSSTTPRCSPGCAPRRERGSPSPSSAPAATDSSHSRTRFARAASSAASRVAVSIPSSVMPPRSRRSSTGGWAATCRPSCADSEHGRRAHRRRDSARTCRTARPSIPTPSFPSTAIARSRNSAIDRER